MPWVIFRVIVFYLTYKSNSLYTHTKMKLPTAPMHWDLRQTVESVIEEQGRLLNEEMLIRNSVAFRIPLNELLIHFRTYRL